MVNNLIAISIATQQAIALNRISSYRDSTQKIRSILGRKQVSTKPASQDNADAGDLAKEAPDELAANDRIQLDEAREFWDPKWSQLFVWQSPIMLLNFSILFYLVGFLLVIIEPARAAMMSWMIVEVKVRDTGLTVLRHYSNLGPPHDRSFGYPSLLLPFRYPYMLLLLASYTIKYTTYETITAIQREQSGMYYQRVRKRFAIKSCTGEKREIRRGENTV